MITQSSFASQGRTLHDVGLVVKDIAKCIERFSRALGGRWDGRIILDPIQSVRVAFIQISSEPSLFVELVEPAGTSSPVDAFVRKGTALHHVCFQVEDLESSLQSIEMEGGVLVKRSQPASAFDGRRIAWIYTPARLLVELLEKQ